MSSTAANAVGHRTRLAAGRSALALATALVTGAGCQVEQWRNADLQLDISGAVLDTEDIIRVCVDGVGSRDAALGAGRVAFPGLPATGTVTVTVDALGSGDDSGGDARRLGRAGPIEFATTTYADVAWEGCTGDCTPCREATGSTDDTEGRLLAVRFSSLD